METVLLEFVGELDVALDGEIRTALESVAAAPAVSVDLSRVTYLDSTVLTALVRLRQIRYAAGNREAVRIYGAAPMVRRIFTITQLEDLFEIAPPGKQPPPTRNRVLVLGHGIPASETSDDFVDMVDRVVRANREIASRDESDGVRRWVYSKRQVQAHCVSDRELVLLKMRAIDVPPRWNVEDVRHVDVAQSSAWHVGRAVADYCLGRSA